MTDSDSYTLRPVAFVRSALKSRKNAPRQGSDGAPDAWIEVDPAYADALFRLEPGADVILLTWLHEGDRGVLQVHPRFDPERRLHGVFATRSPDRPNPIGLHRVTILAIEGTRLHVSPLEAIDGTPIVDIKPVFPVLGDA